MNADRDLARKGAVAHFAIDRGSAETGPLQNRPHTQDFFWLRHLKRSHLLTDIFAQEQMKSRKPVLSRLVASCLKGSLRVLPANYGKFQDR